MLTKHPDISQAYVVGIPNERWGESGCAFIVRTEGRTICEGEILAYLTQSLAKFKIPTRLYFIAADDLPKTGTGKVQKALLRERAMAENSSC